MRPRERRTSRRFARRAQVRYWIKGSSKHRVGFVKDISSTGVFIATPEDLPRGTEIEVEIAHEGRTIRFEAVVARKVWIAPDLRLLGSPGVGARFLSPDEVVGRLLGGSQARDCVPDDDGVYRVILGDPPENLREQILDLQRGGFLVPTSDPPPLNEEVSLEFIMAEGRVPAARAEGRVVQRIPAGQGSLAPPAMAVHISNAEAVLEQLRPHLGI